MCVCVCVYKCVCGRERKGIGNALNDRGLGIGRDLDFLKMDYTPQPVAS